MLVQINPSLKEILENDVGNLDLQVRPKTGESTSPLDSTSKPRILETAPGYFDSMYFELAERTISLIGLIFLAPLLGALCLLVKVSSGGPVIYRQIRLGKNGQKFRILKFRSMVIDAEAAGPKICTSYSDPRITKIGTILRKYKLDELPQLINVIKGEMSLVGPRPERPVFHQKNQWIPDWNKRLEVKPGITGLAQISKHISHKPEQKIYADLFYCANRTIKSDILLIFMTIFPWLRKEKFFGIQLK